MQRKIYFWDGLLFTNNSYPLLEECTFVFQKILDGDYKSVDLKKLKGANLYSARANDTNRLLFTQSKNPQGRPCLLVLEITKHYEHSRFMQPWVLKNFLANDTQLVDLKTDNDFNFISCGETIDFEDSDKSSSDLNASPTSLSFKSVSYTNKQFIHFNSTQQEIYSKAMPLLINGGGGAGKTSIAENIIMQSIEKACNDNDEIVCITYVTQSENLCHYIHTSLQQHPSLQKLEARIEVECKTYLELFDYKDNVIVGQPYFEHWFEVYVNSMKNAIKNPFDKNYLVGNIGLIYQEFRLIAGHDEKSYSELGKHQSHYTDDEKKSWLFQAFNNYQKTLEDTNRCDITLIALPPRKEKKLTKTQVIIIDEAQDLTSIQLQGVMELATDNKIAICLGSHQNLGDSISKRDFINKWFQMRKVPLSTIELPGSYRCPEQIITFCNRILTLKFSLTGGISHKTDFTNVKADGLDYKNDVIQAQDIFNEEKGLICWCEYDEEILNKLKEIAINQADIAFITLPNLKDDLVRKLNTARVFTVAEIKGLEYKNIVVVNLFNQSLFEQASKELPTQLNKDKQLVNRAKKGTENRSFETIFNEIYTAFSRTKGTLTIVQKSNPKLRHLLQRLQELLPQTEHKLEFTDLEDTSTIQVWKQKVEEFIRSNDIYRARDIFVNNLKLSEQEFNIFLQQSTNSPDNLSQTTIPKEQILFDNTVQTKTVTQSKKKELAYVEERSLIEQLDSTDIISETLFKTVLENENWLNLVFGKHPKMKKTVFEQILNNRNATNNANIAYFKKFISSNNKVLEQFITSVFNYPKPCHNQNKKIAHLTDMNDALLALINFECSILFDSLQYMSLEQRKTIATCLSTTYKIKKNNFPTCKPILLLMKNQLARLYLKNVFRNYSDVFATIPAAALGLETNSQTEEMFTLLVTTTEGHQMLHDSLSSHTSAKKAFSELAQRFINKRNLIHCFFYNLLTSDAGQIVFKNILIHKPTLVELIKGTDFDKPLKKCNSPETPLFYLSQTHGGAEILELLLDKKPSIAQAINVKTLDLYEVNMEKVEEGIVGFHYLFTTQSGCRILSKLFKLNLDDQLQKIPFFLYQSIEKGTFKYSLFDWLCSYQWGRKLLNELFDLMPELYKYTTAKVVYEPRCIPHERGIMVGQSLLHLLGDNDNPILEKFFGITGFIENIPANMWCYRNTVGERWVTLIPILCNRPEIFSFLLKKNPNVVKSWTVDDFKSQSNDDSDPLIGYSYLTINLQDVEFQHVFLTLQTIMPDISKQISGKRLCTDNNQDEEHTPEQKKASCSILSCLCMNNVGLEVLDNLVRINQNIINDIVAILLEKTRTEIFTEISLLALLCKYSPKLLARLIIREEKKGLDELYDELCVEYYGKAEKPLSFIPYNELLLTLAGKMVLNIFEKKGCVFSESSAALLAMNLSDASQKPTARKSNETILNNLTNSSTTFFQTLEQKTSGEKVADIKPYLK